MSDLEFSSVLTFPACGNQKTLDMPADACVYIHRCTACGLTIKPRPGDCCVFCSYDSVPCSPKQSTA